MNAKEPRISPTALAEVEAALRDYAKEVLRAKLGEMASNMYVDHADLFVRWLKRDFEPGSRGSSRPRKRRRFELLTGGPG
jgi:hypothetical protein